MPRDWLLPLWIAQIKIYEMWSYFGTKSKLAELYPPPIHDRIIEPFAGAAKYSLLHWNTKEVRLYDKYEVVIQIWKYLQKVTRKEILEFPHYMPHESTVKDLNLPCLEAELLYGFIIGKGAAYPRNKPSKWATADRPNTIKFNLMRIANSLHKIKHWQIYHGDYRDAPNLQSTWFIDPPYQKAGKAYKHSKINYQQLKDWAMDRKGQIIICENSDCDWIEINYLSDIRGIHRSTQEGFWTNQPTSCYPTNNQLNLF